MPEGNHYGFFPKIATENAPIAKQPEEVVKENENLKFLIGYFLSRHIHKDEEEKWAVLETFLIMNNISEDEIRKIFQESKEIFGKFGK